MASKGVVGSLGGHLPSANDRGNYGGDPKRRRGRRGRGKNAEIVKEKEIQNDVVAKPPAAPLQKPPKILTKQANEKSHLDHNYHGRESRSPAPISDNATPLKIKTRSSTSPAAGMQPASLTPKQPTPGSVSIVTNRVSTPLRVNVKDAENRSRPVTPSHSPRPLAIEVPVHKRLLGPPEMDKSIKLVDEQFNWCETGLEMLQDHNDYLVIGVLGLQGSGKSTLASFLAGNQFNDSSAFCRIYVCSHLVQSLCGKQIAKFVEFYYAGGTEMIRKSQKKKEMGCDPQATPLPYCRLIFEPQSLKTQLIIGHQTNGIDLFVTKERIFILDTQPILSSSVLDKLIGSEKNLPPEYTSSENYAEMQSLQLASFLMTVCHVIVLVVDWFPDQNLLEFLKRAEMLKPSTPAPPPSQSQDGDINKDFEDYHPYLAFAFNKASREDFHPLTVKSAEASISRIFKNSKLKFRGCCSLARSQVMPSLTISTLPSDVNLFIIPDFKGGGEEVNIANIFNNGQSILYNLLPSHFKGHPNCEVLVRTFRNQLYASARPQLTHTTLSEKNWFHYAARTWETLRKSSLMTDFNRLLT